jgi:hypothetical protein
MLLLKKKVRVLMGSSDSNLHIYFGEVFLQPEKTCTVTLIPVPLLKGGKSAGEACNTKPRYHAMVCLGALNSQR